MHMHNTRIARVAWYTAQELPTELWARFKQALGNCPNEAATWAEGQYFFRDLGGNWWANHTDLIDQYQLVNGQWVYSEQQLPLEALDLPAALAWVQLTARDPSFEDLAVEYEEKANGVILAWVEYFDPSALAYRWEGGQWHAPAELAG